MSTAHDAKIVFGFPVPDDFFQVLAHVDDWLETERLRPATQVNAGSNNGSPEFLIGVVLLQIHDYTRAIPPYARIPDGINANETQAKAVFAAASRLGVSFDAVGLYLLGNAG